jgi:hypothetical protein
MYLGACCTVPARYRVTPCTILPGVRVGVVHGVDSAATTHEFLSLLWVRAISVGKLAVSGISLLTNGSYPLRDASGKGGGRSATAQWSICSPTCGIRHQRTYRCSLFTNIQWCNFWIVLTTSLSSRPSTSVIPLRLWPTIVTEISSHSGPTRRWMRTPKAESQSVFHPWSSVSSAPPAFSRPLENHLSVVVQTLVLFLWVNLQPCMLGHYPNYPRYRGKCWPHTYYCTGRWPQGPDAATK